MKEEDIKSVCEKAIDYFGTSRLTDKALQDMGMLTASLMSFKHGTVKDTKVIDRLSRAILSLYQMSLIFGIDDINTKVFDHLKKLDESISKEEKAAKIGVTWYYGG